MISVTGSLRVFVCTQPADMRKSFDGLCGMALDVLQQDPLSGHLFLFRNRNRDRLKILYWDRDGLAIWYKRPEAQYPHFFLFTESGDDADNFACRPASAG